MSWGSNFIEAQSLARRFLYQLNVLTPERAITKKEDHCCNSGFCCYRAPGELNKEDLARFAQFKGLTEQEAFKPARDFTSL